MQGGGAQNWLKKGFRNSRGPWGPNQPVVFCWAERDG